ncbi:MAG: D-glycerate dehydrogenase [Phascolarctobacterium sp.]|nr:D-glycerate dehydrogenase [Phascolarctobacterium sp.]MBR6679321.1 D-glycerate dehydrogenase [Phascolarctobacterium sp.]
MTNLKQYTVVASGKMRDVAFEKLDAAVNLLGWQKGGRVPAEQFDEWLAKADALFSTGNIKINEELLAKAPNLKVIAQASVGYDNIDIAACNARNIPVGNTPGVLVDAVADLAYALILDSARKIVLAYDHVKSGKWGENKPFGLATDLAHKTLGVVGMGDIGSAIAERAKASKMKIIYHNRNRRADDEALGATYVTFDELLAQADFIVIAVTLNPTTKGMFNKEAFAKMKDGARIVNISRGAVIDTEAMYEALLSGKLAHAAMDVTDPEPLPGDHKLLSLPNVTVTPHMASATTETRDAMALLTVDNILAGLEGKPMPAQVKAK